MVGLDHHCDMIGQLFEDGKMRAQISTAPQQFSQASRTNISSAPVLWNLRQMSTEKVSVSLIPQVKKSRTEMKSCFFVLKNE